MHGHSSIPNHQQHVHKPSCAAKPGVPVHYTWSSLAYHHGPRCPPEGKLLSLLSLLLLLRGWVGSLCGSCVGFAALAKGAVPDRQHMTTASWKWGAFREKGRGGQTRGRAVLDAFGWGSEPGRGPMPRCVGVDVPTTLSGECRIPRWKNIFIPGVENTKRKGAKVVCKQNKALGCVEKGGMHPNVNVNVKFTLTWGGSAKATQKPRGQSAFRSNPPTHPSGWGVWDVG